MTQDIDKTTKFLKTYSGEALVKKHNLAETGMWQIFGEDPNCDLGGSHVQPNLGFVEGNLEDVINYAVELPRFWQWGAGGSIKKVDNIKKVDSRTAERRRALTARRADYEEMLRAIDAELGKL